MFIIVLGQHVSILTESSSSPSKNTDPYLAMFKGSIFLEGPEDDSIRIETCCPDTLINIMKFFLRLTDTSMYIYTCVKHFEMANIKIHKIKYTYTECILRRPITLKYSLQNN